MRTFFLSFGVVLLSSLVVEAEDKENKIAIAHFGDSTTACTYLRPKGRVDAILEKLLRARYRAHDIDNVNVAEDGEFIRQFLDGGRGLSSMVRIKRYEKIRAQYEEIDIAFIRYGQNDWELEERRDIAPKGYSEKEFKKDLIRLIETLQKDYPGIHIVLETGSYLGEKVGTEKTARRYWDVVRALARERDLPLVDNHKRAKEEEKKRGKFNLLYKAHPTREGVRVHADEEFKVLTVLWPERLPRAGTQVEKGEKENAVKRQEK